MRRLCIFALVAGAALAFASSASAQGAAPAKRMGPLDGALDFVGKPLERALNFGLCAADGGPGAPKRTKCSPVAAVPPPAPAPTTAPPPAPRTTAPARRQQQPARTNPPPKQKTELPPHLSVTTGSRPRT